MRDRFLIDECLNGSLVAAAKARGYDAEYVPFIGKGGWQDWNLVPYAIANVSPSYARYRYGKRNHATRSLKSIELTIAATVMAELLGGLHACAGHDRSNSSIVQMSCPIL